MTKLMKEDKIEEALETLSRAAEEKREDLAARITADHASLKALFEGAKGVTERAAWRGKGTLSRGKEKLVRTAEKVNGRAHDTPWGFVGAASAGSLLLGYWMGCAQRRG